MRWYEINSLIGGNFEGFRVKRVCHQIVAGTNNFYHVVGYPGDVPFTVTIYENLGEDYQSLGPNYESKVVQVTQGHNALCIGHGK